MDSRQQLKEEHCQLGFKSILPYVDVSSVVMVTSRTLCWKWEAGAWKEITAVSFQRKDKQSKSSLWTDDAAATDTNNSWKTSPTRVFTLAGCM